MKLFSSRFMGWPVWTLQQGALTLQIVPAVGGRLMGIACDGVQLCFIHPELAGQLANDNADDWARLCGAWSFPLWGGGKTWLAPESAWPDGNPQRDLDSGSYAVVRTWCDDASAGIEMLSPVCRQSGVQIRRCITMQAGAASWTVAHTLTNTTDAPLRYGVWDVLMLRRAGWVEIGLHADAGHERDRDSAFRAIEGKGTLAELRAARVLVEGGEQVREKVSGKASGKANEQVSEEGSEQVSASCRDARLFKVGVAGANGAMRVRLSLPEGEFDYWREAATPLDAEYAHGHPVEVFNAPSLAYFEVESHAPLTTIPPGGSVSYTVTEGVASA